MVGTVEDGSKPSGSGERHGLNPAAFGGSHYGTSADNPNDDDAVFEAVGGEEENDLFREEQSATSAKAWWKSNFFLSEDQKILFGTFDGVFTSCMINLFGVITLLRTGWIVGNAGIGQSVLIVLTTVVVCSIAVLSGISIGERCRLKGGGVHLLVSHVLGAQTGGAVGLVYCFGQAVNCALHVMGFAESMAQVLTITDPWLERTLGIGVIVLLLGINAAGVKWVIRIQFILLMIVLLAALDFAVGTFIHIDTNAGVMGYDLQVLQNNTMPDFLPKENWFTVFGVFFPAMTGVFAGVNMSGDLRNPSKAVPVGTLAAIGTSLFLYLTFIMGLGATCARWALQTNFMIAENVSAIGVFLLSGLYVSSMSSCLASLYATPRIIQSMASENVIPASYYLAKGKGPNKVPILAMVIFSLLTFVFIMIGQINVLAPIVTIPFLLTYASIEYAYFSMAMTYDIQHDREQRYQPKDQEESPSFSLSKDATGRQYTSYGSTIKMGKGAEDLDQLFPERVHPKSSAARSQSTTESPLTSPDEHSSVRSAESKVSEQPFEEKEGDQSFLLGKEARFSSEINKKGRAWYEICSNRWIALLGIMAKFVIMFLVQWGYALSLLLALSVFWIYIGQTNPGTFPGISEFKLIPWLKKLFCFCRKSSDYDQVIVTPLHPGVEVTAAQLNEVNEDYASREPYHQYQNVKSVKGRPKFQEFDSD